jgi:threonine/homoserine/homoserine lactone efflux protein
MLSQVGALPVDPKLYTAFLGVMAVMALTPGPANLFAVAIGMDRGKRAAMAGILGMTAATLVWFIAAAMGLGVLITTFPQLFRWITVLGALYVAWLGLRSLIGALTPVASQAREKGPGDWTRPAQESSALVSGFLVQIANPKAILFFTAVLPPFLDPARPMVPQLSLFALATVSLDLITMTAYGLGGAALALKLSQPRFKRGFSVMIGLMLLLASVLIFTRL